MSIKFNTVTWYLRLATIIVLLVGLPILTFYIGREYQETIDVISVDGYVNTVHSFSERGADCAGKGVSPGSIICSSF